MLDILFILIYLANFSLQQMIHTDWTLLLYFVAFFNKYLHGLCLTLQRKMYCIQIHLCLSLLQFIKLLSRVAMSLFTVMQLVIQHQTSPGQKMAVQQCCIKERHTALLTYRDRLLEITNVQLGMEWLNQRMSQQQLLYTVSDEWFDSVASISLKYLK